MTSSLLAIALVFSPAAAGYLRASHLTQIPAQHSAATAEAKMKEASGAFEVKITPGEHSPDATVRSYLMDKQLHGAIEGTSKGEMLAAGNPAAGNAGYVAMERVTGTLDGRTGSFALMQFGTMEAGSAPQLRVSVVPGSGTGELEGISGAMTITVVDGKHSYKLEYALPADSH
jgi:hypothetical protein